MNSPYSNQNLPEIKRLEERIGRLQYKHDHSWHNIWIAILCQITSSYLYGLDLSLIIAYLVIFLFIVAIVLAIKETIIMKKLRPLRNQFYVYLIPGLEQRIGRSLKKIDVLEDDSVGYIMDKEIITGIGLYGCDIHDILDLVELPYFFDLKLLILRNNNLSEITGLDNFEFLQYLDLSHNSITEINNLDDLTVLQTLNLENNQITVVEGLETLVWLKEVFLSGNSIPQSSQIPISDFSVFY